MPQIQKLSSSIESNQLSLLHPLLREKLQQLISNCSKQGLCVRVGCTVRGPLAQGDLWCRSRSDEEIRVRKNLIKLQAPEMAACLWPNKAGLGPQMTSHLPGQSWHQWGEAADLYSVVAGKAIWSGSTAGKIAYEATKIGLHHSLVEEQWSTRSRKWHVQLRKEESPLLIRGFCDSWTDVEAAMMERYSNNEQDILRG